MKKDSKESEKRCSLFIDELYLNLINSNLTDDEMILCLTKTLVRKAYNSIVPKEKLLEYVEIQWNAYERKRIHERFLKNKEE